MRQCSIDRGKAGSHSRKCTASALVTTPPICRRYICSPPTDRSIDIQVRSSKGPRASPLRMMIPAWTSITRLVMSARSTSLPISRKA